MTDPSGLEAEREARVREHFATVVFLRTLGVTLGTLRPGYCEMEAPNRPEHAQQHGYLHGGVIATLCDSASGHAALTLMPPEYGVDHRGIQAQLSGSRGR
jgi:uncharacterized protein (TIGR00369 family)